MARSRNIKPSLFKNELLGEADPLLTILFSGLWCLADREGRLEDRPKRIKAEIFPYRELPDFNGYLTELARLGFIDRYEVGGVAIIQVIAFSTHQSPHKTEKASVLPENPKISSGCAITEVAPLKDGNITDEAALIPDSLNLIPDSCNNTDSSTDEPESVEKLTAEQKREQEFEILWTHYPEREGSNPKNKAFSAWKARLKDGVDPSVIAKGLRRYINYSVAKGNINTSFVMQAQRFFGPGKEYENNWSVNHENNRKDQNGHTGQLESGRLSTTDQNRLAGAEYRRNLQEELDSIEEFDGDIVGEDG